MTPEGVESHLPLVRKIASEVRRSLGGWVELDELVAYGTQGLLEARQRFDASRGLAFSTFAYYRIRGAIYDGIRQMGWRPQSKAFRRQARFEAQANLALQQAAEDSPPPGSPGEADAVEGAIAQVATAYVVMIEAEQWARIPDSAPKADERVAQSGERRLVREALASLPEKERRLVELMYFEDKSLTEAGTAIGLSKSWTCRLHARALKLLAEELTRRGAQP